MKTKKILILFIAASLTVNVYSQISLGGKPYSWQVSDQNGRTTFKGKVTALKNIDNDIEIVNAKKLQAKCKNCQEYYGKGIDQKLDIKKAGEKIDVPGGKIWLVRFESPSALGMQFYFNKYKLPNNASLFIYNEDKSTLLGAFTHINNHVNEKFATQEIYGKTIILEYFEADQNEFEGQLEIFKVIHIFNSAQHRSGTGGVGQAAPCTKDINCAEGNNYQTIKKSVCRISTYDKVLDMTGYCSGFLVNNIQLNGQRMSYVMTANHVLSSDQHPFPGAKILDRFDYWIFAFGLEKSSCGSILYPIPNGSHSGANLIARSDFSDYLLLDLQVNKIENFIPV